MQYPPLSPAVSKKCADAARFLSADAVEKANSGHPGLPMGAADLAVALWGNHLSFNPEALSWENRDRFILSAGHGSMLLYSLLHLFGFDMPIEEIKNFRQWGSKTPGHPEFGHTPGVEVTTGPLGQGIANAVGFSIASKMAAARFNTSEFSIIDHYVYALCGDGCLQEGISYEAAALAGHLKLGNLICIYDSNSITIEGKTDLAWSEDVAARFKAAGWHIEEIDGHNHSEINAAIKSAKAEKSKPSLIIAKTFIAYGSPKKQGSSAAHGSPLGAEEIAATRANLGWECQPFEIPSDVYEACREQVAAKKIAYKKWCESFEAWHAANPEKAKLWDEMWNKKTPENLAAELVSLVDGKDGATRSLSGSILQKVAELIPSVVGGSADLAPSNNSDIKAASAVSASDFSGRNLHFGIREHAMGGIVNGLALYGCFIPYGATFLVFSDYCRPAIRLSALMKQQSIYIFTHDSFFVGEDGPTHQPIEHTASLRLIPNLQVIRPADALETAAAWVMALENREAPTALILTRQKLNRVNAENISIEDIKVGGYLAKIAAKPDAIILASGSEVHLALDAAAILEKEGIYANVVSVPFLNKFVSLPKEELQKYLPTNLPKIAIEAGSGDSWWRIIGSDGLFIGIEHFGASAPDKVLAEKFGFTAIQVAEKIRRFLR